MSDTTNKIKAHLKKHQTEYIVGASVVGGVIIGVLITKKFASAPTHLLPPTGTAGIFQIGGENSPLKFAMTIDEALAYNRVAQDLASNATVSLPGNKLLLLQKASSHHDMKVFNMIGTRINEYLAEHGPLGPEKFNVDQTLFLQV